LLLLIAYSDEIRTNGEWPTSTNVKKIKHQKYSVHRSLKSSTGINAIKHSLILEDGEEIETSQYTRAIKSDNGFAIIYSTRHTNMASDRHNAEKIQGEEINMGKMESTRFTLISHVLVGSLNQELLLPEHECFNLIQIKTSHFTVALVWSFVMLPAHSSGAIKHRMTIALPDNSGQIGSGEGLDNTTCLRHLIEIRRDLTIEFCKTLASGGFHLPSLITAVFSIGHFKTGQLKTPEFDKKLLILRTSRLLRNFQQSMKTMI